MVVGKPDININSYGIRYFQKKDDLTNTERDTLDSHQDKINTVTTGGLKQPTKLDTELGSINTQLNAGQDYKPKPINSKFKPSKAKVKPNMTAEQESKFDKISAESKRETSAGEFSKTPKQNAKPNEDTKYYYNKPAKVNRYLGEGEKEDEVKISSIAGSISGAHAPKDVPQGESQRETWNKKNPKGAKGRKNRTDIAGETIIPSSGKGAREEWLKREGVGQDGVKDEDQSTEKRKPLNTHGKESKSLRSIGRDLKNIRDSLHISDEDKKDLTGSVKKPKKGEGEEDYDKAFEKIHGRKYTDQTPKERDAEKKRRLDQQYKEREEAKKKEGKMMIGKPKKGENTETVAREHAEDREIEGTPASAFSKYGDKKTMEDEHKRQTEEASEKEDKKFPKEKERREAILGHVGDKKENTSRSKPKNTKHTTDKEKKPTSKKETKKPKESKSKKTKKEKPTELSETQMKKLLDEKAARDKIKIKSNDIIATMNIMKIDLMKNTPKKGAKQLSQTFIGQGMDAKNSKIGKEKPLKEYDNYDNKHGLTTRTEQSRTQPLRSRSRYQGVTPPAGSLGSITLENEKNPPKTGESPKDLGKSASETIFKAILLKLDLTKTLK